MKEDEINYFKSVMENFEKEGIAAIIANAAILGAADRALIKKILNTLKEKKILTQAEIDRMISDAKDTVLQMRNDYFKEYDEQHL